jgi:hypothetical protein
MAAKKRTKPAAEDGGQNDEIPEHPLVKQLRPDPDEPSTRVILTGYLGRSRDPDRIRLYLGLDFRSYYEFPEEAIISYWPADANDNNSPTYVVVEASTILDLVAGSVTGGVATYLQGNIVSTYFKKAVDYVSGKSRGPVHLPTCVSTSSAACGFPEVLGQMGGIGHPPTCVSGSSAHCGGDEQ